MPAVRPPTLWLSVAATTITAVAVATMAMSGGPRRPLTFAGAVLVPGSHPSAAGRPSRAGSPPVARTAVRAASPARPSASPAPVAVLAAAPPPGSISSLPSAGPARPAAASIPAAASTSAPTSPAPTAPARTSSSPGRAGPPAGTGAATPVSTPAAAVAQALFGALNAARTRAGLGALAWSARLQRSAASHNAAMAAADQLAPRLATEPALGVRQANQGVLGNYAAEVVGFSPTLDRSGALAAQQAMLAEQPPQDGQQQVLRSAALSAVGIDVVFDPLHGRLWITEDFAQLP